MQRVPVAGASGQMSQLEIIHLRSSAEPLESLGQRIRESLGPVGESSQITLYRRDGLETDVAVHIRHQEALEEAPSRLGLQLASALRALGLVEHTLWQELP